MPPSDATDAIAVAAGTAADVTTPVQEEGEKKGGGHLRILHHEEGATEIGVVIAEIAIARVIVTEVVAIVVTVIVVTVMVARRIVDRRGS
mmetsp:Transcript_21867/g.42455  ORF Transcript_21867/g.42455 Transcript_21867/m.42455 type:complete len:90 (+) Transcript_21867:252-521(+)